MENGKALFIYFVGIFLLLGGLYLGWEAGSYTDALDYSRFNFYIAAPYFASGIISFSFFLGLSEIIKLLENIYSETKIRNTNKENE